MDNISNILPDVSIWAVIQLIEIILAFVFFMVLLKVSAKLRWYFPLAVYLLLVAFDYSCEFMMETGLIKFAPHFLYTCEPSNLLMGTMIYLYARSQEYQKLKLFKSDLLYLIPFFLSLFTYFPYYLMSAEEKLLDFKQYGAVNIDIDYYVWEWIFLISVNFIFLGAALKRFQNYNEKIKELYSNLQKTGLGLTRVVIKFGLALYATELLFVFFTYYGFPYYDGFYKLYDIVQLTIIILIGHDAMNSYKYSTQIKEGWAKINMKESLDIVLPVKYAKSTLTPELSSEIKIKLECYMNEMEPFLHPQLRIKDLSYQTGISSHQISQVINASFQQNFYEFVNTYRVKKAKSLLEDPKFESLTFTAIGFEAGFNSKTAFYNAFKKETGTTPAQFKKQLTHPN